MGLQSDVPDIWNYSAFVEGQLLGSTEFRIDENRLRLWSGIFDWPAMSERLSVSLLVSAMMEAYLHVAQPRPPGNIHAGQKLWLHGRAPHLGEALTVTTRVAGKEERKGRKWLAFESNITSGGDWLLKGEILTIWAE
ncbi:hypothetical protein ANTHELSMS3_05136 (plasmid) [Antarctobacter heliothermus]|uniref:Uncharacterized protein n=1 Tax=Antarctobacter heliothermus TaxID=74033 RepID=A0A222EBE3_9RHOB|nr:hypothetical protein [Antarctobacter heliothermus]ASP23516.1 hypothetical protein ANTHELSMS3_05136 [Antarctobacter heliothermus]